MSHLDIERMQEIYGMWVDELAKVFQPIIPEGFRLFTNRSGQDIVLNRIGGSNVFTVKDNQLIFKSNVSEDLNAEMLHLATVAIKYKTDLCKFTLTMDGLKK